jgi:outer membrane protein insertion porin family
VQKLVGRAQLSENNFRGLGEHVSLTWEVGGVISATSVELNYVEPYLDKRHTSGDIDLFDKAVYRFASNTFGGSVGSTNLYVEQHVGISLGANRPLSDTASAGLSIRYENVKADNVQLPPQDLFLRQEGTVGAIGFTGLINTRDVDLSPASGGLRSAAIEFGSADTSSINNAPSPLVPGEHAFVKTSIDLRQYISLQGLRKPGDFKSPKKVVAVRLLLGTTNKDIPFFEQYFLGGPDDLRGYVQDRFWGSNLLLFQGELRIPFSRENTVQGVLLTDIGDVWGSIYQDSALMQSSTLAIHSDFGFGVRLVTPVGPIRLDYAVGNEGGQTQFSIGQSF